MASAERVLFLALFLAGSCGVAAAAGSGGKDLCLLYSQNCPNQQLTLQEKIQLLRQELAKGRTVYTPDELQRLSAKLADAESMLYNLLYGPGAGGHRR